MQPYLYIRVLRHADHTVFCVDKGQKSYWDPQFQRKLAYSSGQQVKRGILETIMSTLNVPCAPITFITQIKDDNKLGEGEAWAPCDPTYIDQLLGGWMRAEKGGSQRTIKRRSPLSISAMRPLHPLLCNYYLENLSYDRSDRPELHEVKIRDKKGKFIPDEKAKELLKGTDRSLRRKWVQDNPRTVGLFVYDMAIDLRTLFCVLTNQDEPELSEDTIEKLKSLNWAESRNIFGTCLVLPKEERDKVIPALAHAILNWRVTSNQARTFSPLPVLAVAIGRNANRITDTIRARLEVEGDQSKAVPIIEEIEETNVFVTPSCDGYVSTNLGKEEALKKAQDKIVEYLDKFDYEKQMIGK